MKKEMDGLTFSFVSQDYPKNRHPGWSRGSIAYHAGECWLIMMVHDDLSMCFLCISMKSILHYHCVHIHCVASNQIGNGTKLSLMFLATAESTDVLVLFLVTMTVIIKYLKGYL